MDWFDDISDTVGGWFADDTEVSARAPVVEEPTYDPDYGASDSYGSLGIGTPGSYGGETDVNLAYGIDVDDNTWDNHYDSMFELESDASLLDSTMKFAGTKTGQGLIGGLIGAAGKHFSDASARKFQEEQARLAHQRRLEAIAAGGRSGGGRTPAPGSADVTKSKLAANMVRRS